MTLAEKILDALGNQPASVKADTLMALTNTSAYGEFYTALEEAMASGKILEIKKYAAEPQFIHTDFVTYYHATEYSIGADVFAAEDTVIEAGTIGTVKSTFKLPVELHDTHGVGFLIASRSSFPRKYGLMLGNGVGILETDYKDEIAFDFYNTNKEDVTIKQGAKIGQVVKFNTEQFAPTMKEVRDGGFGSTDKADAEELIIVGKPKVTKPKPNKADTPPPPPPKKDK